MPIVGIKGSYSIYCGANFGVDKEPIEEKFSIKHSFETNTDQPVQDTIKSIINCMTYVKHRLHEFRVYDLDARDIIRGLNDQLTFGKTTVQLDLGKEGRLTINIFDETSFNAFYNKLQREYTNSAVEEQSQEQSQAKITGKANSRFGDTIIGVKGGFHFKGSVNDNKNNSVYSENYECNFNLEEPTSDSAFIDLLTKIVLHRAYRFADFYAIAAGAKLSFDKTKMHIDSQNLFTKLSSSEEFTIQDHNSFKDCVSKLLGFVPCLQSSADAPKQLMDTEATPEESLTQGPAVLTKYRLVSGNVKRVQQQEPNEAPTCLQRIAMWLGM